MTTADEFEHNDKSSVLFVILLATEVFIVTFIYQMMVKDAHIHGYGIQKLIDQFSFDDYDYVCDYDCVGLNCSGNVNIITK